MTSVDDNLWFTELMEASQEEEQPPFSGSVLVTDRNGNTLTRSCGYANRSERITNTPHTRFAMASGCKIFTAVAICQLVEAGRLELDTRLNECLVGMFPGFDARVTVRHLLTHSSGIPDYFDEETMSDFAELWVKLPVYTLSGPADFVPLFQHLPMKFTPGERFSYNNAGYIVLGLIVEKVTGLSFTDYVEQHIFAPCGMTDSGYFRTDRLPERTALGYIDRKEKWHTNIFALPFVGGPDGGAYTTVGDLQQFWQHLTENRLLTPAMTTAMLTPHMSSSDTLHYGYGVWISLVDGKPFKYFVMGYDPGVTLRSSYYVKSKRQAHFLANREGGIKLVGRRMDELIQADEQEERGK